MYKRQGLESVDINEREWERLAGVGIAAYGPSGSEELRDAVDDVLRSGMETVLMIHHGAVSYTHLDVYKRQLIYRAIRMYRLWER